MLSQVTEAHVIDFMSIPEFYFKNVDAMVEWHKSRFPESYEEYLVAKKKIKDSGFSGSTKLLKNLESDKSITGFLSFLTEINIANLLLRKLVSGLFYEPKRLPGVDFLFENVAISVKNLHPKNYEKDEEIKMGELEASGGGAINLTHKNFSNIAIQVEKTEMGTFSRERMETGHSGFLDSDLYEMSAPLSYIGEFEEINIEKNKKVLFFFIQSSDFAHYYINDIVIWYFGCPTKEYQFIFQNDPNWYYKLFKKTTKKNNIDALVFMYRSDFLIWPPNSLTEVKDGKTRLMIYAREKVFSEKLRSIFS